MLKLIRLFPNQDLFTVQGRGVQAGAIPIGTYEETRGLLIRIGVEAGECDLARQYLSDRPDHNAVDFGVTQLAVTTSLTVDLTAIHRSIGLGPSGLLS